MLTNEELKKAIEEGHELYRKSLESKRILDIIDIKFLEKEGEEGI